MNKVALHTKFCDKLHGMYIDSLQDEIDYKFESSSLDSQEITESLCKALDLLDLCGHINPSEAVVYKSPDNAILQCTLQDLVLELSKLYVSLAYYNQSEEERQQTKFISIERQEGQPEPARTTKFDKQIAEVNEKIRKRNRLENMTVEEIKAEKIKGVLKGVALAGVVSAIGVAGVAATTKNRKYSQKGFTSKSNIVKKKPRVLQRKIQAGLGMFNHYRIRQSGKTGTRSRANLADKHKG